MINLAVRIAADKHRDQVDKLGVDYIAHVMSVWYRVRDAGLDDTHQVVALLHDVVEDTNFDISSVRYYFGDVVAEAVQALTKVKGEEYEVYLDRVAANPIAARVKWHDSMDNYVRIYRIDDPNTRERLKKKYDRVFARIRHLQPWRHQ